MQSVYCPPNSVTAMRNVVVIGGGPAGMMAAIAAAEDGNHVVLLEKNEKTAKKLYITGKGRCNITNRCDPSEFLKNVVSNPKFLMSALNGFTPEDAVAFFEQEGVPLKTERGRRVFPASDAAGDICDAFRRVLKRLGVEVRTKEPVLSLECDNDAVSAVITKKARYLPDVVILATGGMSYPGTGSTGDGFRFAGDLGLKTIDPVPALCPVVFAGVKSQERILPLQDVRYPEGLSLKNVRITVRTKKGEFSEFGEMLFTVKGVSGPAVLTVSSRINRIPLEGATLSIDLKPALDEKTLDQRLVKDFTALSNKQFKNSLGDLLPRSLIPMIVRLSGIDPERPVHTVTRAERTALTALLKGLTFSIASLGSQAEAIVTAGGVAVSELFPKTMASKKIKNLRFAGELIDVDALTGGYNLQIAMATGYAAGKGIL